MPIVKPFRFAEINHDLSFLTASEILWTWRHRQRAFNGRLFGRSGGAMNQAEAAETLGISLRAYSRLEQGGSTSLTADEVRQLFEALGPLRPTVGELCTVARRRSGEDLPSVAEAAGISRLYYLRLERAGDPSIVEFWENHGFQFPVLVEPEANAMTTEPVTEPA